MKRYPRLLCLAAGLALAGGLSRSAPGGEVIDNAKLEMMCKEGIVLDVILKLLEPTPAPGDVQKGSNCRFDDSPEAMISLQKGCKDGGWQQEETKKLQTKVIELANKDKKYLKELVDRAVNIFENADETEYGAMMRTLAREGKRVVPYLLAKLEEESERKRGGVVDALGRMGDKSENVVRSVALMLGDERSKPVRLQAAKAVVALAGPATTEELIARLGNRTEKLDGVAMALGYVGDQRAVEPLTKLLRLSGDSDARVCAAFALGELRAKSPASAEALLEAVLDERDDKLREAAAAALAKVGEKRTPSYIIKAFYRFRPGRDALMRNLASFKDIAGLEFLVEQVSSDDPKVKKAAVETLRLLTGENENDADGWRGILEVLRTRPDWRANEAAPRVPDAGRERGGASQKPGADAGEGIPATAR